ncbi:class I SAM-dependent methyltransferase [Glaciihabitans sp. dw_435]|uniref:class I SAM-dependent methyltransferase n=1 Tax=Glaciihabitans sp. dw_435 TaxID=2720081 RepID=UPI001BD26134|nr:class I SAM-dependent methyltransferase [Glaciihabitans sp. dw_435]
MSFDVAADAYSRFMGRFSEPLAGEFAALLGLRSGQRALDVGCGPGALTSVLVEALGESSVAAVDPSAPFVGAVRSRYPLVDCRQASAESLPFESGEFDVTLAQLVVHFMDDPVRGIREMARVTRPGGTVAATVWDFAGGAGPLAPFREAQRSLDPDAHNEATRPGTTEGDLARLFAEAGLLDVRAPVVTVEVQFASFEQWWEPFTLGVGPVGDYLNSLTPDGVAAVKRACAERLPAGPFSTVASAWVAIGTVGSADAFA